MNESDKIISETLKSLNEKYGENSIVLMDQEHEINVEATPTGCFALDRVFGCGGLPKGRVIELFGEFSSGKSTLALFLAAQVQKSGGRCAWIDAEFCFSADYAKNLGVDVSKLIVSQPTTGEEALDIVAKLAETEAVDLVVIDSVSALVPKSELEGEIGDISMATQARMLAKGLRILTGALGKTNTTVLFLNQVRDKIGVFYGSKVTTPGGKALKFYASVRLEVKKLKTLKNNKDEEIGTIMGICAVKNKVAAPFKKGELELYFGKGVDVYADALDTALELGVITKKGNTHLFGKVELGAGHDKAKEFLRENTEVYNEVVTKLK